LRTNLEEGKLLLENEDAGNPVALESYAGRLEDSLADLERKLDGIVKRILENGEDPSAVRQLLEAEIRRWCADARLDERVFSILPGVGFRGLLACGRLGPAPTAQDEMARLIAAFVQRYRGARDPLPKQAFARVILLLRRIGVLFDSQPPTISIELIPAKAGYNLSDMTQGLLVKISFADDISGPDPDSLSIVATVGGSSFDLTSSATSSFDPITGEGIASMILGVFSIPDGFVTLTVRLCDMAGNCGLESVSFLKDTLPPAIAVSSPAAGSTIDGPTVPVDVKITDEVSGIDTGATSVFFNGVDVSQLLTFGGTAAAQSITGELQGQEGSNQLEITAIDNVGNVSRIVVDFVIRLVLAELPPKFNLMAQAGEDQEGFYFTRAPETLVWKVLDEMGNPVEGVTCILEIDPTGTRSPEGEKPDLGAMIPAPGLSFVSDKNGIAGVNYVFGNSSVLLRAFALLGSTIDPPRFELTALGSPPREPGHSPEFLLEFVTRDFEATPEGFVKRDGSGEPIAKKDPERPLEVIQGDKLIETGTIREGTVFDDQGIAVGADKLHEYFIRMVFIHDTDPPPPEKLDVLVRALDIGVGAAFVPGGVAPYAAKLTLKDEFTELLEETPRVYRTIYLSKPFVLTSMLEDPQRQGFTLFVDEKGTLVTSKNQVVIASSTDGSFDAKIIGAESRSGTTGHPAPVHLQWVSLGDSLTNGTMETSVFRRNQLSAYPKVLADTLGVSFGLPILTEPGIPPAAWGRRLPDGQVALDNPDTLFFDRLAVPPRMGGRDGGAWTTHNFAIDGMEFRQIYNCGRFLDREGLGALMDRLSEYGSGPKIGADAMLRDFALESVAALEPTSFGSSRQGTHFRIANEALWFTHPIIRFKPEERQTRTDQVINARAFAPELVLMIAGNNDGLESLLSGLTISTALTPLNDDLKFNRPDLLRELHSQQPGELDLQTLLDPPAEKGIPSNVIPEVRSKRLITNKITDSLWDKALGKINILSFSAGCSALLDELSQSHTPDGLPSDMIVGTLPPIEAIPVVLRIPEGEAGTTAHLGKLWVRPTVTVGGVERTADFPYRLDFFGVTPAEVNEPVADFIELLKQIPISNKAMKYDPATQTEIHDTELGAWPKGTQISILAFANRFGARLEELVVNGVIDVGLVEGFLFKFFSARSGLVEDMHDEIVEHWPRVRQRLFKDPYEFRADEVLIKDEIDLIRDRIGGFNTVIRNNIKRINDARQAAADPRVRERKILIYDLNAVFKDAVKNGRNVPELAQTLDLRLNGGLFSMDGVHPGRLGHALIAQDMYKLMLQEAEKRKEGSQTFGGLPLNYLAARVKSFERMIEQKSKDDQVYRITGGK
jgi:lysophospholipase L1-like esterase